MSQITKISASQTDSGIGGSGAGDFLNKVIAIPSDASSGSFTIKDGSDPYVFYFGNSSTSASSFYMPFEVVFNSVSSSGAWTFTTSSNVSLIVFHY